MKKYVLVFSLVMLSELAMSVKAAEEPRWTLLGTLGEIEVRQYEPLVQARTPTITGSQSSSGFKTLAGYIFGGNAREQKIAMTAPVESTLARENNYMAFTMPEQHSMENLPEPDARSVTLHQVPQRTMAVISFSGWAREEIVQEKLKLLLATLHSHGIETLDEPSLAQYNPPWTPPWSRRNEVMVEIPVQP